MTIKPSTLTTRLEAFRKVWSAPTFTREDVAAALKIPVGTASASCSYAAREGLLVHNGGRPRKYSFPPAAAPVTRPNTDALLNLVAEIDAAGVKRSTIVPLLRWVADALEGSDD